MKILLNNIELILKTEVLDISSANPFLDNDEERLDNIFSVEIPIVGNEKALGYIDNIDIVKENEYSCEIISSLNFIGVAIVTEASTADNKAILQIGYAKSNFNYLIKDKKMKEIDFGTIQCAEKINLQIRQGTEATFISHIDDTRRYLLPFSYISGNANYFSNNNLCFADNVNINIDFRAAIAGNAPWTAKIYYQKNNETPVLFISSQTNDVHIDITTSINIQGMNGDIIRFYVDVTSPLGYLFINRIYADCTILNKDFAVSANLNSKSTYCFPLIQNNEMMSQLPDGLSKTFYDETYPLINNVFTQDRNFFKIKNGVSYTKILAPCISVSFVIETIFKNFGYIVDKNNFDSIYNKLLLFNGTIIGDYKSTNNNFYVDIPIEFSLNKCFDNDILISDFLNDLYVVTGFFALFNHEAKSVEFISLDDVANEITEVNCIVINDTINYDNDKKGISIEITTGEDSYLKENYNDLESYNYKGVVATLNDVDIDVQLDDCYYISTERKYYVYSFGKATENATTNTLFWKFVSWDFRLKIEDGKEEFVTFKSETPIMVGTTTSVIGDGTASYQNINIPITQQPIRINKAYETYNNKYSNSFLINRGIKEKSGLGEYLYASADNFYGQTQSNEISLRVDGEYGIANRMYQKIAQTYKTGKKHTINGYMKATDIQKLTYKNFIYINNSVNILLSYNYKLTENDFKEIELELIKI